ncbi:MAG: 16S rRNA (cytosine(967)-C(5))-methyltransferase RsmB [Chthoniobacteraceae bacterium]
MSFSNSRTACVQALHRWESGATFADEVLHSTLAEARFNVFDRAFLTETFYGILRRRSALDFLIRQLRDTDLDSETRQVLRLGFYQIFWMRIPHHAAVNETVNLAGRARGLVNALLRRAIREKELLDEKLAEAPASVRFSHPKFLIERWESQFTPEETARLCEWNNTPAEIYVRANRLKVTTGELLAASPSVAEASGLHPLSIRVKQVPFQWLMEGLCYVQDPSTLMAVELLDPKPGDTILDACAAPGGKASYMAELMGNSGRVVACDSSRPRLERLRENMLRMNVSCVETRRVDWLARPLPFDPESFDRILVDAPCSNTGVIRRRVDVRWRLTPGDFEEMPRRQRAILDAVFPLLKPGGTLVYSTCSMEPEEDNAVAEAFARETPGVRLEETGRRTPHRDAMDGAFAARLVKGSSGAQ